MAISGIGQMNKSTELALFQVVVRLPSGVGRLSAETECAYQLAINIAWIEQYQHADGVEIAAAVAPDRVKLFRNRNDVVIADFPGCC